MENIQLDELVYTYPEYDEEHFQTLSSAKQEFRDVGALRREPVPKRGELFRHQKFFKRFMVQYDNQLVINQTGTGKTFSVLSVTEHYKQLADSLEKLRVSNTPYKRAYVLVKGDSLVNEFKHQLVCKFTDSYITQQIIDSKTESQRKGNISRSISKFYTITTYGTFAKQLLYLTDDQLRSQYDHSIFIVDEVHNINDDKSGGILREEPVTGNPYYIRFKRNKLGEVIEEKKIESRLIYDQLWRLFHTVTPRKVMLLSATPMINDPSELTPRLNLILPEDNQIPEEFNYRKITLEEFEPYCRGLISYVRALDTGAIPVYQGEVIEAEYFIGEVDESEEEKLGKLRRAKRVKGERKGESVKGQMVVYATEMGPKQANVYQIAIDDPTALRPESKKPGAFSDLERQVANFVFPDDSTGSVGYKKYVIEDGNDFRATQELQQWISSPEHLRALSAKFSEIVRLSKEDPGNSWCYSDYIRGSGAIVLGLCFEAQGFERFTEINSVFSSSGEGGLGPVCGGKSLDEGKKDRFVRIPKKLRYGLLTSETSGPESATLLELFNSYENRHGDYIKAIIGSPVTRDGLNLANVLQIHLTGPGWNQSSSYQAESRAIRSTSQVDLIEEEREKLILEGKDPSTAHVIIKVYRHAAVNDEGTSIDIDMYQLSEIKDREIKRVMRMMKQCSVDCQINYARNVRSTDVDGSAACDYDVCQYKCVAPLPQYLDTSSYDVLYSGDVVASAMMEIRELFNVIFTISFNDLYEQLKDYRRKFIDLAASNLVEEKTVIIDRYGYVSYLREDRGTLFLSRDYPLRLSEKKGSSAISEYVSTLLGISEKSLDEYNSIKQRGEENVFELLSTIDPRSERFSEIIDDLTLDNRILLLEKAINDYYIQNIQSSTNIGIIDKFRNNVFIIFEPNSALKISEKALSNRGKGRGRKPREGSKFKLSDAQEKQVEKALEKDQKNGKKNEPIYFHNLSSATQALTAYAVTAKSRNIEGQIRMFKPSENIGWRDANEYENPVYNNYIKNTKEERSEELAEFEIYGTILEDGKFRIIDKTTEDVKKSEKDARKINRGRICYNGWKKPELIQLLWKLRYNPFTIDIEYNKGQLVEFVVNNKLAKKEEAERFPLERLRFYYSWLSSGVNRTRICDMLQEYFQKEGKLIRQ